MAYFKLLVFDECHHLRGDLRADSNGTRIIGGEKGIVFAGAVEKLQRDSMSLTWFQIRSYGDERNDGESRWSPIDRKISSPGVNVDG